MEVWNMRDDEVEDRIGKVMAHVGSWNPRERRGLQVDQN
jgi:hypothetical protein